MPRLLSFGMAIGKANWVSEERKSLILGEHFRHVRLLLMLRALVTNAGKFAGFFLENLKLLFREPGFSRSSKLEETETINLPFVVIILNSSVHS